MISEIIIDALRMRSFAKDSLLNIINSTDPIDHNFGKAVSSNSLGWHVKALLQDQGVR